MAAISDQSYKPEAGKKRKHSCLDDPLVFNESDED